MIPRLTRRSFAPSSHGVIDVMRGGLPPLDYDTTAARALENFERINGELPIDPIPGLDS